MKLQSTCLRYLGLALALPVAGCLCARAYCDSVTIPTAPNPSTLVTEVEAVLSVVETEEWIVADYEGWTNAVHMADERLAGLWGELTTTNPYSMASTYAAWGFELLNSTDPNAVQIGQNLLQSNNFFSQFAAPVVADARTTLSNAVAEVERRRVISSATLEMQQSTPEGGLCECPDYTLILEHISAATDSLNANLQWLCNTIADVLAGALGTSREGMPSALAVQLRQMLLTWQMAAFQSTTGGYEEDSPRSDYEYRQLGGNIGLVYNALAHILERGADAGDNGTNSWGIVASMRQRIIGPWYTYPTNTAETPLYVTASTTHPLYIWQHPTQLRLLATNTYSVEVAAYSTNALTALLEQLTNATFNVWVENSSTSFANAVATANVQAEQSAAREELSGDEDPERPNEHAQMPSVSFFETIKNGWRDSLETWRGLITQEQVDQFGIDAEPTAISFSEGFTMGIAQAGEEVAIVSAPEYYWVIPDNIKPLLRVIRGVFFCFWGFVILRIFRWALVILVLFLRLNWYMAWGIYTGKAAAVLNAMQQAWNTAAKALGVDGIEMDKHYEGDL